MVGKNVQKWLGELTDSEPEIRLKAADNILKTSEYYFDNNKIARVEREQVLTNIASAIEAEEPRVRMSALHIAVIVKVWHPVTRKIINMGLTDSDDNVLAGAVYAAGAYKTDAGPMISDLLALADHPNREVRWRIPWALAQIRQCPEMGNYILIRLTRDNDHQVRMQAFAAISSCFDKADRQIYKCVVKGLKDRDDSVRGAACQAVGVLEHDWKWIRRKLKSMARKDVPGVQAEAILALCRQWPSCASDKQVNAWLQENSGYWWAKDLLDGKKLAIPKRN